MTVVLFAMIIVALEHFVRMMATLFARSFLFPFSTRGIPGWAWYNDSPVQ